MKGPNKYIFNSIQFMFRTGLRIPSRLTPCYFHFDASFMSRLANTDDIDRPIYGLSAQVLCSISYYLYGPVVEARVSIAK